MKQVLIISILIFSGFAVNAQIHSESILIKNLKSLKVSNFSKVVYKQSHLNKMVVKYDFALDEMIEIVNTDGLISATINYPSHLNFKENGKILRARSELHVYGDFESLRSIETSGVIDIEIDIIDINKLLMRFNGCGLVKGNVESKKLAIVANASNFEFTGKVHSLSLDAASSNFKVFNIGIIEAIVSGSSSNFELSPENILRIVKLESSNITYIGNKELKVIKKEILNNSTLQKI